MSKEMKQSIEQKFGEYVFSLRNFKYIDSLSEETNCFTASLYVNGQKIGFCKNSGRGGSTDITILPTCRELGKTITEFLVGHPKVKCLEFDFDITLDFEYIVDILVEETLKAQDKARIMRMTVKNLVFKDKEGNYYKINWKGHNIIELVSHESYRQTIRTVILRESNKGSTLVNENIPKELLPVNKQDNKT